jgi:hypothetical protein
MVISHSIGSIFNNETIIDLLLGIIVAIIGHIMPHLGSQALLGLGFSVR